MEKSITMSDFPCLLALPLFETNLRGIEREKNEWAPYRSLRAYVIKNLLPIWPCKKIHFVL